MVRYASISRRVDQQGRDEGPLDSRRDSSKRLWHRLAAPPSVSPVPTEYRNSTRLHMPVIQDCAPQYIIFRSTYHSKRIIFLLKILLSM